MTRVKGTGYYVVSAIVRFTGPACRAAPGSRTRRRPCSACRCRDRLKMTTNLPDDRIEIVAEIANAHQGDPDRALQLAREALKEGADAVKFQVYFASELLVRAHPLFDHF